MKKNFALKSLCYMWMAVFLLGLAACKKDDSPAPKSVQSELQSMVDQLMMNYKDLYPDFSGGVAIQVFSDDDAWFVSSGLAPGTNNGIHFRAASNTKTITSTAIFASPSTGKTEYQ